LALVENLQRSDLNPIEEAEAYAALQEKFGLSQEEVATRVGKARTTVTNALRLLRLPDEVLDLLREGRLTAGPARPLLAIQAPGREARRPPCPRRTGLPPGGCGRRAAESQPEEKRSPKRPACRVGVHTAPAEEPLPSRLQTRVEIKRQGPGGHRGQLRIHFHS